jgi:hypothetical protein
MSYGTPGIFFDGTTSVSGLGQQQGAQPPDHDYFGRRTGGAYGNGRGDGIDNGDQWSSSAAPPASTPDLATNDDWQ